MIQFQWQDKARNKNINNYILFQQNKPITVKVSILWLGERQRPLIGRGSDPSVKAIPPPPASNLPKYGISAPNELTHVSRKRSLSVWKRNSWPIGRKKTLLLLLLLVQGRTNVGEGRRPVTRTVPPRPCAALGAQRFELLLHKNRFESPQNSRARGKNGRSFHRMITNGR